MGAQRRAYREAILVGFLVLTLGACAASDDDLEASSEAIDDGASAADEVVVLTFTQPSDCNDVLPAPALEALNAAGLQLIRGPGSPSAEPIYIEGETPEELVGGLSCFFGVPGEDDSGLQILLSVAAVTTDARPGVIDHLLGQELNIGNTNDGALTYWKWGDEVGAAEHNTLYEDSWYSAILQPGGRSAYDQGVGLVASMRTHTTQ
jgi:hypothetical protein